MSSGGGGTTQVTNTTPPPTQAETELQQLNVQLAQRQLANIDQLAPYQTQLLQSAQDQLNQQQQQQAAYNAILSPTDIATAQKNQFDQQQALITRQQQDQAAYDAILSPSDIANAQKSQFDQQQALISRQQQDQAAFDAVLSPADIANAQKAQFDQANNLGGIQTQLAQMQLQALQQGGRATEQQKSDIAAATDAAIASGSGDINSMVSQAMGNQDIQTKEGIGMIADQLANARGLRFSDSPMTSEAALLTRSANDQKSLIQQSGNQQIANLTNSMRANQANAVLNYPLAVEGLQSGINMNQQNIGQTAGQFQAGLNLNAQNMGQQANQFQAGLNANAQNLGQAANSFQAQLQQQAYQNRMAMGGQAASVGLGMSSLPGVGLGTLNSMQANRFANSSSTNGGNYYQNPGITQYGQLASGVGMMMLAASDRRLKDDYGVVGKTDSGINLHVYRYKGEDKSSPVRLGVMADEAEKVRPDAVHVHRSGYKVVDYSKIGIGLYAEAA